MTNTNKAKFSLSFQTSLKLSRCPLRTCIWRETNHFPLVQTTGTRLVMQAPFFFSASEACPGRLWREKFYGKKISQSPFFGKCRVSSRGVTQAYDQCPIDGNLRTFADKIGYVLQGYSGFSTLPDIAQANLIIPRIMRVTISQKYIETQFAELLSLLGYSFQQGAHLTLKILTTEMMIWNPKNTTMKFCIRFVWDVLKILQTIPSLI